MTKQIWKPSTLLNPVPIVMVTCIDEEKKPNVMTVGWAGTINTQPPMVSISVRKSRYSYQMIKNQGEFVINLATEDIANATDFCGVKSGKEVDKFKEAGLTLGKSSVVEVPFINESPVNLECKVKDIIELGSHDMFLAEIVAVQVDDNLVDSDGKLDLGKANLICYSHGEYWGLSKPLGYFGYSVTKKENLKRTFKNRFKR